MPSLNEKIDSLIASLTKRNEVVQAKKEEGPWGWIIALILSLLSLVGIGVAMYYSHKRAKELAEAKTALEQAKVDQDHQAYLIKEETHALRRKELREQLKKREVAIQKSQETLEQAQQEHEERRKKIENLNAWSEINEA